MNIYLQENGKWKMFKNVGKGELEKRDIMISTGAWIGEEAWIGARRKIIAILSGYKYHANAYRDEKTKTDYISLGCFIRLLTERKS